MDRLAVETPLAGDDEVGVADDPVHVDGGHHDLGSGPEARPEDSVKCCAEAAGGARARHVRDGLAEGALDDRGVVGEVRVEDAHELGRRPLLRPENRRRAIRTDEGIVDVAGDLDRALRETRVQPRDVDPFETGQRAAAVRQFPAARIDEANAERLQHSGAAVVRGAAADADDEPARAVVEGGPDEFADAEGRRHQRIAQGRRNELEPRSRGHFDHRDVAVARDAVKRLDLVAERPDDPARDATPSGRSDKRVHGAFPAVGDRQKDIIRVGVDGAESLADGERRVERRQALLERVRRNQDPHRQAPEVQWVEKISRSVSPRVRSAVF